MTSGPAGDERHPADGWAVRAFADPPALEQWLDDHHHDEPGLWIRVAKARSGIPSVTLPEAQQVAMCFGWVDSKLQGEDDRHYLLRFGPRRARSSWTAGNRALAERLVSEGRMRPAGLAAVEAAKSAGRWS